jgi:hypothetical protein
MKTDDIYKLLVKRYEQPGSLRDLETTKKGLADLLKSVDFPAKVEAKEKRSGPF